MTTTTIGPNTRIDGRLEGDGEVIVEGRVEGTVVLTESLTILDGAFVSGDIEVPVLVVEGAISGTIRCSELVHLRATAQVFGEIFAAAVRMDPGASLKGHIEMDVEAAPPAPRRTEAPAARSRTERAPRAERTERAERPERTERAERPERAARPERPERVERAEPTPAPVAREERREEKPTRPPREEKPVRESRPRATSSRAPQAAPVEREQPRNGARAASTPAKSSKSTTATIDADEMTVKELRDMLKAHDLPVSGTKQDLIDRLREIG